MSVRRVLYVGGLPELEQIEARYQGRLCPQSDYVFGAHCDLTTESDLLWADLHRAFRRARLTPRQRFAVKLAIQLVPYADIARQMGVDKTTAYNHARAAYRRLDALPPGSLGCLTTLAEQCGGLAQIRYYI